MKSYHWPYSDKSIQSDKSLKVTKNKLNWEFLKYAMWMA